MPIPSSSTNLKNRVNKLHLPKTKPLLPLFELISNSIHAIEEKRSKVDSNITGKIIIKVVRDGGEEALLQVANIEYYPINSFLVEDNGIGLNSDNYQSFQEFDSEYKATIGGKGVGRLVCLKAFQKLIIDSTYHEGESVKLRKFEYKRSKDGFDNYEGDLPSTKTVSGTIVTLSNFDTEYKNQCPKEIIEIARQIITHFQLYFIQKKEPEIIIRNQDTSEVNLTNLFNTEFQNEILKKEFNLGDTKFTLFISKSYKAKSHKLHYCAHERTVKEEGLSKYINDFRNIVYDSLSSEGYFFQVFIVGEFLNKNVNEERTSFNFSTEDDSEELDLTEISLAKIRRASLICIEDLLKDFLTQTRKEKMDKYIPIITTEYPNYYSVINYNKEQVEKLPSGLSKEELDIKLYEIESQWRLKVKSNGIKLLEKKKDITELDEYKNLYNDFLTEFNEIGQSDLARYVIHRRAVIDLLEKLIELNDADKFTDEDIIHSLFFPIRETSQTIMHEKQNLWLLDERLTFNTLLASDKQFRSNAVQGIDSASSDRIDLIIRKEEVFENATLFAEVKTPFESFTIVEFKKPDRDDYKYGDEKLDPTFQLRRYIRETISGNVRNKGRVIDAKLSTPFYCYIIADITPSLKFILDEEGFDPTPDGLGRFKFYERDNYKAYVEVLPFVKVISDAKQRNKVLFDNLNLST